MHFDDKIILITGGTGSWGHELVNQLLEKFPSVREIRIYSRGEHRQVEMMQEFNSNPKIQFIIGDVRDKNILNFAMTGVHIVFHLAALKHVPVCEKNAWEAVLTNIYGTQNVIEAALTHKVEIVVDVSTDKAVEPFNVYGMTKAVGEKLAINSNFTFSEHSRSNTKFICIRGGNVIGTNGSVIPLFKKQLSQKNSITITNPDMTRYLMSTNAAIGLIFAAVEKSIGGELFVMNMPATNVRTIAEAMIELFGNRESNTRIIGMRSGEKKHEVLISKNEASTTKVFSDNYFVILPQITTREFSEHYAIYPDLGMDEFTSANTRQLNKQELLEILANEPWIRNL